MTNIESIIKLQLKELENKHTIHILFACESGSRAWGFPSPDSDYDARFIYIHPQDWYLSIHEERDVIELPINKDLDINGWELRKVLRLLIKRNAILFEWIQSPIIYSNDQEFMKELSKMAHLCFSPIAAMHHYLSSAKKYYEECTSHEVKLKKYLYCLRCTLAAAWIAQYQTVPPMEIKKLFPLITTKTDIDSILKLIDLKATKDESYVHSLEPQQKDYLMETITQCERIAPLLPTSQPNQEQLNSFFRMTIKQYGH
jgi:predicted nucleotidyltransferase